MTPTSNAYRQHNAERGRLIARKGHVSGIEECRRRVRPNQVEREMGTMPVAYAPREGTAEPKDGSVGAGCFWAVPLAVGLWYAIFAAAVAAGW